MKYILAIVWLYFMVIGALNIIELSKDVVSPTTSIIIKFLAVDLIICLFLCNHMIVTALKKMWDE